MKSKNGEINMKSKIEEESNNSKVLKNFTCEGLEPHNRSLKWLVEVLDQLGAEIELDGNRRYDAESFTIRLQGTSGVIYRISAHFRRRQARLIANRIDDVDIDDQKGVESLMYAFNEMMSFETHWYDSRDGDWEGICIENRREKRSGWPGDTLVGLVSALSDDLRSSLRITMTTLRRELREAYPISWFNNQTSPDVTFADVVQHVEILKHLAESDDREEFLERQAEAFEQLGIMPDSLAGKE